MKIKEVMVDFIKKYKIESVSAFAVSVMAAYIFDLSGQSVNIYFEILNILVFVMLCSFFVDKLFIIYQDKIKEKIGKKYLINDEKKFNIIKTAIYIIVVIIEYLFYRLSMYMIYANEYLKYRSNNPDVKGYGFIIVCVFSIMLILYFIIKEKEIDIKDYLLKIFMNFLFVFLVEGIMLIGFLFLYLICEVLLGTIPYYIISRVIIFTVSMVCLMGFFVGIENVKTEHSLLSKIVVRYIMQIMVFVGFIIFYIYLIKIIMIKELPKNQVFAVCTTLFFIGLFTSLMSLAIKENTNYNKLIRFLPIAFIPALFLQIISIVLRINQHGLTANRYFCIVIIIFEIMYLIFYVLDELLKNEKVKIKNIFLIFDLLILTTFLIPKINVYEFPKIYNNIFVKQTEKEIEEKNKEHVKIHRDKYFNFSEIDISGFNKLKPWLINVYYENAEGKYFITNEKKEYDNTIIDITNIIDTLHNNVKNSKADGYKNKDIFNDFNIEIITGSNKMILKEVLLSYDEEIDKIVNLKLEGYLVTK